MDNKSGVTGRVMIQRHISHYCSCHGREALEKQAVKDMNEERG